MTEESTPSGLSPVQLENMAFTRIVILARQDIETSDRLPTDCVGTKIHLETEKIDIADAPALPAEFVARWLAKLSVKLVNEEQSRSPYWFDVEVMGVFLVHEIVEEAAVPLAVRQNARQFLLAAAREQIANITARCVAGTLQLPLLVVQDPAIVTP